MLTCGILWLSLLHIIKGVGRFHRQFVQRVRPVSAHAFVHLPKPIAVEDDEVKYRRLCNYIIDTIPLLHWHSFFDTLVPPNKVHNSEKSRIRYLEEWMVRQCILKGITLKNQHYNNIQATNFDMDTEKIPTPTSQTKRHLFILDLEGSILYQKETVDPNYKYPELREYNNDDLRLSLYHINVKEILFVLYRPHLMQFIEQNINDSDFIIFTRADRDNAIHHLVTIEFFFNYVWRLLFSVSNALNFKAMIARMPNEYHKNIGMIQRILDLKRYDKVYVIDDMFEGDCAEWTKSIPQNLLAAGIQFYAYNIAPFISPCKVIHHKLVPVHMFRRPLRMRMDDKQLCDVNISQQLTVVDKHWRLFGNNFREYLYLSQKRTNRQWDCWVAQTATLPCLW